MNDKAAWLIVQALRELWPAECGPFMGCPLQVVADWYEDQGDAHTAIEFREIAAQLAEAEACEYQSILWRS